MYEVYSQQRPGRPRWALASSALLLLFTILLAAALTKIKARAFDAPLGELKSYATGGLEARLPKDWQAIPSQQLPAGIIAGASEPREGRTRHRSVFVFRGKPSPGGISATDAWTAIDEAAQSLTQGLVKPAQPLGPGHVGWLPGWTIAFITVSPIQTGQLITYLGRAAVAPDGQVVGVILTLPGQHRTGDEMLLDKICSHVSLFDLQLAESPVAVMDAAGINFELPNGIDEPHFLAEQQDTSLPRIRMLGGLGQTGWYLNLYRVPLMGSATPERLIEDYALSRLHKAEHASAVETSIINDREVAYLTLPAGVEGKSPTRLFSVRTDEQTALVMVGKAGSEGEIAFNVLCRSIAGKATVQNYNTFIDIDKARRTARIWLNAIRSEGLSASWAPLEDKGEGYLIRSPGLILGRESKIYRQYTQSGKTWWKIEALRELIISNTKTYKTIEQWLVREDAAAHRYESEMFLNRQPLATYTETRPTNIKSVERRLEVVQRDPQDSKTPIDDTYTLEPVLMRMAAKMARDPAQAPAIFNTTETFTERSCFCILVPLGKSKLPGPEATGYARAVRLQMDYSPSPTTLYYGRADKLLAIEFNGIEWYEWVQQERETKHLRVLPPKRQ